MDPRDYPWSRISDYESNVASESFSVPPGAKPEPDNQGSLPVCTTFAIAKAIGDGFMEGIFVRTGRMKLKVDIDQAAITNVLLNEFQDGLARWPQEFNGKTYQLQDSEGRHWKTPLTVEQVDNYSSDFPPDFTDFIGDIMGIPQQLHTYVVVYPVNPRYPNGEKHSVYAERLQPSGEVHCINSHLNNPRPRINIFDRGITIYKVTCHPCLMTSRYLLRNRLPPRTASCSRSVFCILFTDLCCDNNYLAILTDTEFANMILETIQEMKPAINENTLIALMERDENVTVNYLFLSIYHLSIYSYYPTFVLGGGRGAGGVGAEDGSGGSPTV